MSDQRKEHRSSAKFWLHLLGLVIVAPLSMTIGFYLMTGGSTDHQVTELRRDGGPRANDGSTGDATPETGDGAPLDAVERITSIAGIPIRPAPRVSLGAPHYWRCFNTGNQEPLFEEACGRLRPLERRVASHLSAVVRCYQRLDMHHKTGTLSLAIDFDFAGIDEEGSHATGKMRFWSGRSSTLDGADGMITCIRSRLSDLSLRGIEHAHERYTIFFPVEFQTLAGQGTPAEIVLDKVRLRREPVKGKIIARLKQGEPVVIYQVHDGWAKLRTVDRREGWVFAPAITIPDP